MLIVKYYVITSEGVKSQSFIFFNTISAENTIKTVHASSNTLIRPVYAFVEKQFSSGHLKSQIPFGTALYIPLEF